MAGWRACDPGQDLHEALPWLHSIQRNLQLQLYRSQVRRRVRSDKGSCICIARCMVRGRRCLGHDETKWGIALIWHVRGRPAPLAASPRRATALGWHACMHVLYTLSSLLCCHNRVSAANFDYIRLSRLVAW